MNKDTADPDAVSTWGHKCDYKVGSHHFGYLREKDPKYVVPGTHTSWKKMKPKSLAPAYVVVKNGDSLGKIARANKMTVS